MRVAVAVVRAMAAVTAMAVLAGAGSWVAPGTAGTADVAPRLVLASTTEEGPCGAQPCPPPDEDPAGEGPCGAQPCPPPGEDPAGEGACGAQPCPPPDEDSAGEGPCGAQPCPPPGEDPPGQGPCGPEACAEEAGEVDQADTADAAGIPHLRRCWPHLCR